MPKQKKTVTIAKGDIRAEVLPSSVQGWQENGWTLVDDGSSETDSHQDETVLYDAFGESSDQDKE